MLAIGRYVRAQSVAEAAALLESEPGCRALAGGTDLLEAIRVGATAATTVVDLKTIPGLADVSGSLFIGPLTTIHELERSQEVRNAFPFLAEAASVLGSAQVRNRATVGGNLCDASPAADMACPLLVADATLKLESSKGVRYVPLTKFFEGPGKTDLRRGELLAGIACAPALRMTFPGGSKVAYGGAYIKLGTRKAMDIAIINVAVYLGVRDGRVTDARIALGSVAPTPFRATEAEAALNGRAPTAAVVQEAARAARAAARPIDDLRASAWYRSEMVEELVGRAIRRALEEAGQPEEVGRRA